MRCIGFAASLALCSCVGSMVRAPKPLPASGVVECTDTMEMPVAATLGAVASAAAFAYGMTHLDGALENGGIIWLPLLGGASVEMLVAGGLGYSYASECRDAKRRGAELARRNEVRAKARAEAGVLWKRAAAAARAENCTTVRELDPRVRELDVEFHAVVFERDVAIARCLAALE